MKVLALASKEARDLSHTFIGTEHILLGLLGEGDGVAARVLKNHNVDIEQTRREILKELDPQFPGSQRTHDGTDPASEERTTHFTPRAHKALALARREADRLNHHFVGREHVLLGVIALGNGVAANVLLKLGLDLEKVRKEVEKQIGIGPDQKISGNISYTPGVRKVFAAAAKEAGNLNHANVGTEHILLGLLREGDGALPQVWKNLGVDTEKARAEILKELDPNFGK
jgi:ATP-dependent Clp protease ATP-binding subunit ClpA